MQRTAREVDTLTGYAFGDAAVSQDPPVTSASSRSLTRRYVAGFACLAVLAMAGYGLLRLRTMRGRNAAHVVNVMAYQRTLAERIAADARLASMGPTLAVRADARVALGRTLREWDAREAQLRTGAPGERINAPSDAVAARLDRIEPARRQLAALARQAAASVPNEALDARLDAARAQFGAAIDGMLEGLEIESRARVDGLETAQLTLLLATLTVLLVEALLVFRPAVRKLERLMRQQASAGQVLASQNDRLVEQACELETQNEELVMQGEELARQGDEIARAQEFLRSVVSSSNDAIIAFDREHRYLEVNPQAERLLGRSRDSLLGRRSYETFAFLDTPDERGRVERMLEDGRAYTVERAYPGFTGGGVYETAFSPLRDSRGAIVGALGVTRDATARKSYERALVIARDAAEEANRERGEFMARMNHELRTPLTVIIGFTRVLAHTAAGSLGATERGYLERVDAHSRHLLALVNDVLDVAKMDAGEMEVERVPTDIAHLAAEAAAGFEVQAVAKGLWLRTELPEGEVTMSTDPTRLRQVLTNLLGNAVKFTEAGGVTVRVKGDAAHGWAIEVSDTGIGIPRARQEAVFDAFEQASVDTHRRFGGTGLGLSISRSLCELLEATLTVESEEGRGTTFRVGMGRG